MIFFVSQMITYSCQLKSFSCSEHRITTALHPFAEPCSFPYQKWLASTLVVVSTLSMSSWCLLLSTSISSLISLMNLFASLSHLLMSVSQVAKLASVSTISWKSQWKTPFCHLVTRRSSMSIADSGLLELELHSSLAVVWSNHWTHIWCWSTSQLLCRKCPSMHCWSSKWPAAWSCLWRFLTLSSVHRVHLFYHAATVSSCSSALSSE